MNPGFEQLQSYPFEKLAALKKAGSPVSGKPLIDLSLGEPKHKTPDFILKALTEHLNLTAMYPSTRGMEELRETIAKWLTKRFSLPARSLGAGQVLPVNGTREALFAIAQCVVNRNKSEPLVVIPNPFYQIYEGAALLAGATPYYVNMTGENEFQPDFSSIGNDVWRRCELLYLCSPNNPTGAITRLEILEQLLDYAERYDFVIAADECYSEIYPDEDNPPLGLLEAAAKLGQDDYRHCIAFHSLSKRSNVPGLRSGFVAGDADIINAFYTYRTYHGGAMPLYVQRASRAAWSDETHVLDNRNLYREKFAAVLAILQPVLDVSEPEAGFYLWPRVPINDVDFARSLYLEQNLLVLPGRFLSRPVAGSDPGANRLRIALTAPLPRCIEAAERMAEFIRKPT